MASNHSATDSLLSPQTYDDNNAIGGGEENESRRVDGDAPVGDIHESRTFWQLGLFVNDGSGSMCGAKGQAVQEAMRETISRFKISGNRDNFRFGIVAFASTAKTTLTPTDLSDSNLDASGAFDPTTAPGIGGGTNIAAGLSEAKNLAETFLQQPSSVPKSVVILVLSDGMDGCSAQTLALAKSLKASPQITLCTCFFASRGSSDSTAKDHLRAIATDGSTGFLSLYDAESLRAFFVRSMSSVRKTGGA